MQFINCSVKSLSFVRSIGHLAATHGRGYALASIETERN